MSLAEEMAEWEVHALRNLLTVLIVEAQFYARHHPEARVLARSFLRSKRQYDAKQMEALLDPVKRKIREELPVAV